MWAAYQRASKRAPLKTNMLTAAGVMFIGDGVAQFYETTSNTQLPSIPLDRTRQSSNAEVTELLELPRDTNVNTQNDCSSGFKLDLVRSTVAMTWNACVFSPTFYYWFRFLDAKFAGTALKKVAAKVLINQLVIPLPISAGFIAFSATFEPAMRHLFPQNTNTDALGSQPNTKLHEPTNSESRESAHINNMNARNNVNTIIARSTMEQLADHWQDVSDEIYTRDV